MNRRVVQNAAHLAALTPEAAWAHLKKAAIVQKSLTSQMPYLFCEQDNFVAFWFQGFEI